MLVSAIIPSRGRPAGLRKTLESLFSQAHTPDDVEAVIKLDAEEDQGSYSFLGGAHNVTVVFSHRGNGYSDMPRFVYNAAQFAKGDWSFLIDDDAHIEGDGWDDKLRVVPAKSNAFAQCEFYVLGDARYGSDSCGPNGLFIPTSTARCISTEPGAADQRLYDMTAGKGWTKHLLQGVRYVHDGRPR